MLSEDTGDRIGNIASVNQRVLELPLDDAVLRVQDHNHSVISSRGETNGVAILVESAVHYSLRDSPLDRADQVTRPSRRLVVQCQRRGIHIILERLD